jgi:hypothetical protein
MSQLVAFQSIEGHVFVARDAEAPHNDQMTYEISKLPRLDLWGLLFFPRFAKNYIEPNQDDKNIVDKFDEVTNPW